MVYDATRARFQLADRTVDTLEELTTLRGATTELRTGARLVLDVRDELQTASCAEFARSFVEDAGHRPSLSFVDVDGVWVAEDFDSLVMVSTYYNFELSREFFITAGVPPDDLSGTTTFYEPTLLHYDAGGGRTFGFDSAAFVPCISSFLVFAGDRLQDIPLGANPGVAAHEYAHLAIDRVVFGADGAAAAGPAPGPPERLFAALNEGLADFFGAAVLGDPNFAARALTASESGARDLDPGDSWSAAVEDALVTSDLPNPYAIGTVWGSMFWDLGASLEGGGTDAAALAIDSLERLRDDDSVADFTTATMVQAVLAVARGRDDGGKSLAAACAAVDARFSQLPLNDSPCPR